MKSLEKGIPQVTTGRNQTLRHSLIKAFFATAILGAGSLNGYAQDFPNGYGSQQSSSQHQNSLTDQSLRQAIAPYNEDVRNDILIASQYPDILQKLGQVRDQTTQSFQQIIGSYPQKKQNWFYEVSRYPDLMDKLANLPRHQSREQIEGMLTNPTPELKEAAWKLYENHHKDLVTVNNLNKQALNFFQDMINPLSRNAQNAFKTLQEMPDVLSLLNDHIDVASRLGESYRNDPSGVSQDLADLHDKLDAQNKQDLASYKDDMSQDPQALQELNQASKDYASTGGYSYPAPTGDKVINYGSSYGYGYGYGSPYSYFFGYPMWYNSPMWYPGGYGYGSGIYFGLGGGYGSIFGLPSIGFSRWFFGGAYRHYPNLYRQYGRYYRDNIGRGGYNAGNRSAFMGTANRHFVPNMTGRSYGFNNNQAYRQGRSMSGSQGYSVSPRGYSNQRSYSAPSNRSFGGGASRSYSSPSFGGGRSGGGGYGGGGFHGGGGGRGGRH